MRFVFAFSALALAPAALLSPARAATGEAVAPALAPLVDCRKTGAIATGKGADAGALQIKVQASDPRGNRLVEIHNVADLPYADAAPESETTGNCRAG